MYRCGIRSLKISSFHRGIGGQPSLELYTSTARSTLGLGHTCHVSSNLTCFIGKVSNYKPARLYSKHNYIPDPLTAAKAFCFWSKSTLEARTEAAEDGNDAILCRVDPLWLEITGRLSGLPWPFNCTDDASTVSLEACWSLTSVSWVVLEHVLLWNENHKQIPRVLR